MSATNLDLPVLISADQIRRREFVTIRRGYDPDQVRAYLEQLADQIELMRVLLREAQQEAETAIRTSAQPHEDPYEKLAHRVAGVIREADLAAAAIRTEAATDAERLTLDARADADRLTLDARADADRIRTDAQAKAEEARSRADEAVRNAREEADRTIAGLSTRRDSLVDQLASMQERLIGVARDLESAMDVNVTLPAIQSFDELFDESKEAPARSPEGAAGADAGSAWAAQAARDDAGSDGGPTDAERSIVVGEAEATSDHAPEDALMDPSYEELWDGTDAIKLDLPDIPALDLDWGDADDDRS